jgi:hypothetical protein
MAVYQHVRLGQMTAGARRGLAYLVILGVAVNGASLWLGARAIGDLRAAVRTECAASRDIGDLAHGHLANDPKTGHPSRILINYIAHNRAVFYGLPGCPGHLESPSPQFTHWAKVYHVPSR